MTWTKINKPSAGTWTSQNAAGKEQYDQTSLTYDSATTFYDGVNMAQWTTVAKPTGNTSFSVGPGNATGLLMSPTYPYSRTVSTDLWTRVAKPN